jgi:hypothetical protein
MNMSQIWGGVQVYVLDGREVLSVMCDNSFSMKKWTTQLHLIVLSTHSTVWSYTLLEHYLKCLILSTWHKQLVCISKNMLQLTWLKMIMPVRCYSNEQLQMVTHTNRTTSFTIFSVTCVIVSLNTLLWGIYYITFTVDNFTININLWHSAFMCAY